MTRKRRYRELLGSDQEWLRNAFLAKEYWSLYFFCKVGMFYKDLHEDVHLLYCEFLDEKANKYKLALMPRDFVKSWILRAKAYREYLMDNDVRILIAMATEDLARDASDQMAAMATANPLMQILFPECIPGEQSSDRWTAKARTLPRRIVAPEPTFKYVGVKTEIVSGHYTFIFGDDVFAREAAESEEVAGKVFSWAGACEPLLDDPETSEMIHVCTRWAMDDLAVRIMGEKKQSTDELVFRAEGDRRYICLKRSAIEDGKAIWSKFDEHVLSEKLQGLEAQQLGHMFGFWYLNNPIDSSIVEFPRPRYWSRDQEGNIVLQQGEGKTVRVRDRDLTMTMTVDPSYKEKKSHDDTSILVIGTHPAGYRINMYSWLGKAPTKDKAKRIVDVAESFALKGTPLAAAGMETNASQIAFYDYVNEAAKDRHVAIPWRPISTPPHTSKHNRIRQMVGVVADGFYYTHGDFIAANNEMRVFPASRRDNWLDAFAYQPQIWPKISRTAIPVTEEEERPWYDESARDRGLDDYGRSVVRYEDNDGYGG